MKKTIHALVGAAAAVGLVAFSTPAFALTAAHMSANTNATQGDCSGCHIPHRAAGAQRLFPAQPSGGSITSYGFMGAMCAEYCHNQVGTLPNAYAANTALLNPGGGATGVAAGAHGLGKVATNAPPNTVVANTLPYGNGTTGVDSLGSVGFECTTCHNVHKNATGDTSEALLTLDIDALCDECHTGRGAGDGAWGGAAYGDGNPGTHPVGTNVTGDNNTHDYTGDGTADADSNIFIGMATSPTNTSFDAAYGASASHNLGGHLINGVAKDGTSYGPITCNTCHAVHGTQADANPQNVVPQGPYEDLLVIQQGAQGAAEPTYSANGAGDPYDALCAGCHARTTAGADNWNPGATQYSHPANAQAASGDRGVPLIATLPAPANAWPYGSQAPTAGLSLGVICESCHKPHGATANSHILRLDEAVLCEACHTGSFAGHHPANVPMGGMTDADIGDNNATLTCSDCHNGSGAHNWLSAGGVGLDPQWEPYDNGRPGDSTTTRFQVNTSKECYDCHSRNNAQFDPTLGNNNPGANLETRGLGSHYIGPSANTNTHGNLASGNILGTGAYNAFTGTWNAAGGWSRFGGTGVAAYEMVCESCHDLEPDKQPATPYAALLYAQSEQENTSQSNLCTGCHGLVPGGSSVHPLTNDVISKAVDANRATTTLLTAAGTYADAAGSPNQAEYPATANWMNCDSCHQVHDAPTASGTYILEYNTGSGTGLANIAIWGYSTPAARAASGQNIDHDSLCTQCHAY